MNDKWLTERIEHIQNKKSPSDQQRLLVLLCEKEDKTPKEEQDFKALVRAEKAVARLEKAAEKVASNKSKVSKILKAERSAKEKARTHELIKSAGLLIQAGLVDSKTGKPIWDTNILLKSLINISNLKIIISVFLTSFIGNSFAQDLKQDGAIHTHYSVSGIGSESCSDFLSRYDVKLNNNYSIDFLNYLSGFITAFSMQDAFNNKSHKSYIGENLDIKTISFIVYKKCLDNPLSELDIVSYNTMVSIRNK